MKRFGSSKGEHRRAATEALRAVRYYEPLIRSGVRNGQCESAMTHLVNYAKHIGKADAERTSAGAKIRGRGRAKWNLSDLTAITKACFRKRLPENQ